MGTFLTRLDRLCRHTLTVLPVECIIPRSTYSLTYRQQSLELLDDGQPAEQAAPLCPDGDRLADSSTVRRWFHRRRESLARLSVRGGARGYHFGGPHFASVPPRLSLCSDHLRTVLAVKGSLRRAQRRRALDCSGPFWKTAPNKRERLIKNGDMKGNHFAAKMVPFLAATDTPHPP